MSSEVLIVLELDSRVQSNDCVAILKQCSNPSVNYRLASRSSAFAVGTIESSKFLAVFSFGFLLFSVRLF